MKIFHLRLHWLLLIFLINNHPFLSQSQSKNKGKRIECTANILRYDASISPDIQILTGNVIFTHEGAICYADTALYNEKENIIEAFGKELIIHINDTVHLYGKYLTYNGNTKIFTIEEDVILSDEYSVLYTDKLTYFRNENYGFYINNGKIVNDSNTLTSQQGWYYTSSKDVYFKNNVLLTTPDYTVKTDTLQYNTKRKIAYFLTATSIYSDENTIYCEAGWYDTENDTYQFQKNAQINTKNQQINADTIWYDKKNEKAKAYHNIIIFDSVENAIVLGNYLDYNKEKNYAYITDSAIAVLIEKNDSLFIHADTLWAVLDSAENVEAVLAYHKVLFYRDDIQGSCDSLVYLAIDSIITMFTNPLIWFEDNQILADTIRLFIENKAIKEMHLINNSFICEDVFLEKKFNQIKGRNMFIYFKDNQINNVFVNADAECLYYVLDEMEELIGINNTISNQMQIYFLDNEVYSITFYEKVKGDMTPENEKKEVYLKDFIWLNQYRPKNKTDIFMQDFYNPAPKTQLFDNTYDD